MHSVAKSTLRHPCLTNNGFISTPWYTIAKLVAISCCCLPADIISRVVAQQPQQPINAENNPIQVINATNIQNAAGSIYLIESIPNTNEVTTNSTISDHYIQEADNNTISTPGTTVYSELNDNTESIINAKIQGGGTFTGTIKRVNGTISIHTGDISLSKNGAKFTIKYINGTAQPGIWVKNHLIDENTTFTGNMIEDKKKKPYLKDGILVNKRPDGSIEEITIKDGKEQAQAKFTNLRINEQETYTGSALRQNNSLLFIDGTHEIQQDDGSVVWITHKKGKAQPLMKVRNYSTMEGKTYTGTINSSSGGAYVDGKSKLSRNGGEFLITYIAGKKQEVAEMVNWEVKSGRYTGTCSSQNNNGENVNFINGVLTVSENGVTKEYEFKLGKKVLKS